MINFIKWLLKDKAHRNALIVRMILFIAMICGLVIDTPDFIMTLIFSILILGFGVGSWLMPYLIYKRK